MLSKTEIEELLRKATKFKDYVDNEFQYFTDYYDQAIYQLTFDFDRSDIDTVRLLKEQKEKDEKFFNPIVDLIKNYRQKFQESYENWERQIKHYGKIYFNNDKDRLNLSMCSSTFTNDDYGNLTPFGPWLVGNGELMGHHQIGILDALISQLPQPKMEGTELVVDDPAKNSLIKVQMILVLVQKQFVSLFGKVLTRKKWIPKRLRDGWNEPAIIQFSEGNTGAWAADREIPTIIHVNNTLANSDDHKTRITAYTAVAHEFGHKISDSFTKDRLIQDLIENIERRKYKHGFIWGSWMHEIFADAIGIRLLGKVSLDGLRQVLERRLVNGDEPADLIIENFSFDSEFIPYEPHPNNFLRYFIALELADELGKVTPEEKKEFWEGWKEFYKANFATLYESHHEDFDNNIFHFKDQLEEEEITIDDKEVRRIADAILNTRLRSLPSWRFPLILPGIKWTTNQIFGIPIPWFRIYVIPWIGHRKAKTLIEHLDQDSEGVIKALLDAFEEVQTPYFPSK